MHKKQSNRPDAFAVIQGSGDYPDLKGNVMFRQMRSGVLVTAEIEGLPSGGKYERGVFGFHIHEGGKCSPKSGDAFTDAGGHYDNKDCPHPYHAGDLPPLFSNKGYAYMSVFTDRFNVNEIIGKTVIIHGKPDDFTSQPSGNAGKRIACGKITY